MNSRPHQVWFANVFISKSMVGTKEIHWIFSCSSDSNQFMLMTYSIKYPDCWSRDIKVLKNAIWTQRLCECGNRVSVAKFVMKRELCKGRNLPKIVSQGPCHFLCKIKKKKKECPSHRFCFMHFPLASDSDLHHSEIQNFFWQPGWASFLPPLQLTARMKKKICQRLIFVGPSVRVPSLFNQIEQLLLFY